MMDRSHRSSAATPLAIIADRSRDRASHAAALLTPRYTVILASTDKALFGLLRREKPAIIMIDDDISPSGGLSLVADLKSAALAPFQAVLMMDRNRTPPASGETIKAKLDGLLIRPYTRARFFEVIGELNNRTVEQSWDRLPALQKTALTNSLAAYRSVEAILDPTTPTVRYDHISALCGPLLQSVQLHDFAGILDGVKGHDNYSFAHSVRVATLLALLGNTTCLPPSQQLLLTTGGLLHDAGKMTIPLEILNKPERLTDPEWQVMRTHVSATANLLTRVSHLPKGVAIIAAQHHEKLDGSGYPHGLKGRQLNELARMASIIDIFCALTDKRPYKPAMSAEKALAIMNQEMAGHIDLNILALFRHILLDLAVQ